LKIVAAFLNNKKQGCFCYNILLDLDKECFYLGKRVVIYKMQNEL